MFSRLSCHFCGTRSKHSKATTEFQCADCEALNFFDFKGNVVETPAGAAAAHQQHAPESKPFQTFTRKLDERLEHQQDQTFCNKCLNNQRIYTESLSNYLPDPEEVGYAKYKQFEDKLPEYKAKLERQYPQVCKRCATNVQEKIRRADIYGKMEQASEMMITTRERRGRNPIGQRDDWDKWVMRFLLGLAGMMVNASLLAQMAWHSYGMLTTMFSPGISDDFETADFAFDQTFRDCAKQSRYMRFNTPCYQLYSTLVPRALIISLCLLWYTPGLKDWWHHTYRMEAITGQTEHRRIQALLWIVRLAAWYYLSDATVTTHVSTQQLLAAHGFMIAFMILIQWISGRTIKTERWKMRGKIMPSADEVNVFGSIAGPATDHYERQASSVPPVRLFQRDQRPFPIENLAPRPVPRGYSKLEQYYGGMPPPSPPDSQSVSDDGEAMDLDWRPSLKSQMPGAPIDRTFRPKNYGAQGPQTRSTWNYGTTQPSGWGAMRNEIFDIQDNARAADERKLQEIQDRAKLRYQPPVEQSPFRGRLPAAPMSMERRLRNPPLKPLFNTTPLSQQKDFMSQMREGVENVKTFAKRETTTESQKHVHFQTRPSGLDDDEDFSPAKSRTRGQLELRESGWRLPGDGKQTTGLEDLFAGKSFTIADEPGIKIAPLPRTSSSSLWTWTVVLGVPVAVMGVAWNVQPVRRAMCLWLVQRLEEIGY